MEIRLQCYEGEKAAAVAGISSAFNVKSVSKGYPNVRSSAVEGTPCETRYYIKIDGLKSAPLADALVLDGLRFIAMLDKAYGIDTGAETEKLRAFYAKSGELTAGQQLELLSEWRAALLLKCLSGKR